MIVSALFLGLASSLHCVVMCGPIAFMLPLDKISSSRKLAQLFMYHFGRISTYSFLGIFFGIVGRGLYLAGIQQKLSIVIGVVMVAMAIVPEKRWAGAVAGPGIVVSRIKSRLGKRLHNPGFSSLYVLGLLNGLLPCGMVYAAVFGALAMQQVALGGLYMLVFGLGTLPLMAGVNYGAQWISVGVKGKIRKLLPAAVICIGMLFILRGMGLGISMVSPGDLSLFVKAIPDCH